MTRIDKIDYSAWTNNELKAIASETDKNKNGLQGIEIFNFGRAAIENHISENDFLEQVGISLSQIRLDGTSEVKSAERVRSAQQATRTSNPVFDNAVNYYNTNMNYSQRGDVTRKTYDNLQTRLYNMEKSIDNAYLECKAYQDIVIIPRGYYKYYPNWTYRYMYPNWADKLINFDIDDMRTRTTEDMQSLNQLRQKAEDIIGTAGGDKQEVKKVEYDVNKLAQKHLGMSYEEFSSKYKKELDFCKTVTEADLVSMNETQRMVYAKAKAYAKEMIETTIIEAHNANWDINERKLNETLKATESMYVISNFEFDTITEEGLSEISSGIMRKSFEEALISKYLELDPTGVESVNMAKKLNKPVKGVVNGVIFIFHPNGSIYDGAGRRVK